MQKKNYKTIINYLIFIKLKHQTKPVATHRVHILYKILSGLIVKDKLQNWMGINRFIPLLKIWKTQVRFGSGSIIWVTLFHVGAVWYQFSIKSADHLSSENWICNREPGRDRMELRDFLRYIYI